MNSTNSTIGNPNIGDQWITQSANTFLKPSLASAGNLRDPHLWLKKHVYACTLDDCSVFLDLRRNRYSALDSEAKRALPHLIHGWSSYGNRNTSDPPSPDELNEVASALRTMQLVTNDPALGKPLVSAPVELHADLIAVDSTGPDHLPVRTHHVKNFLIACYTASVGLRCFTLERVVQNVMRRKMAKIGRTMTVHDAPPLDVLVSIFRRLRRFTFTSHDRCLFHSLALVNFLARYECFPVWVIGVKTRPWGAHSWVQQGNLVLDATPEQVLPFTPIMAI